MPHNVYLAGKIYKGDYRNSLVFIRDEGCAVEQEKRCSETGYYNVDDEYITTTWSTLTNAIGKGLNYTGPYFISCDHGCSHREEYNHAWLDGGFYCNNEAIPENQQKNNISRLCQNAINKTDIFFAYINSSDCHGTLVEIGYAYQKVKHLIVVYANEELQEEVWFPSQFATLSFVFGSAKDGFWKAMRKIGVLSEYVYIAWEKGTSKYKIGKTNDPDKRLKQLNSGTKRPTEVEMIKVLAVEDSSVTEDILHSKFADKNIRGEWFNLHPFDVQYLLSLDPDLDE